jgi:AcrR family transcriptional regulator
MNKSESKYYNTALLMDEALLILLETKDFEFITVKEICQKAGVNRSTFYLHYQNTSDLLAETMEYISNKFFNSFNTNKININQSSKEDVFFLTEEYILPYLAFVKENVRMFKLIHDKPYLFDNKKAFNKLYNELFTVVLDKYGVKENKKKYIFEFYTQGTLSVVMKWISEDCKEDINFICEIIKSFINID